MRRQDFPAAVPYFEAAARAQPREVGMRCGWQPCGALCLISFDVTFESLCCHSGGWLQVGDCAPAAGSRPTRAQLLSTPSTWAEQVAAHGGGLPAAGRAAGGCVAAVPAGLPHVPHQPRGAALPHHAFGGGLARYGAGRAGQRAMRAAQPGSSPTCTSSSCHLAAAQCLPGTQQGFRASPVPSALQPVLPLACRSLGWRTTWPSSPLTWSGWRACRRRQRRRPPPQPLACRPAQRWAASQRSGRQHLAAGQASYQACPCRLLRLQRLRSGSLVALFVRAQVLESFPASCHLAAHPSSYCRREGSESWSDRVT